MAMGGKHCSWPDHLPWKTRLLITGYSLVLDASMHSNLVRRVLLLLEPKAPPSTKPVHGVASSDVTVDPSRNLWLRIYVPSSDTSTSLPLIIYFHGGGFTTVSPYTKIFDKLCRRLSAELKATVISLNYRLAPENRYPSQNDDGLDVLKFIDARNYAILPSNTDLNRCFIAGDSAGGNIAHHVTLRAGGHEFQKLKIIGLVAIQPLFGGEERTESELRLCNAPLLNLKRTDNMWRSFLPAGSDRNHMAANIFGGGSKNISAVKFPATIMFVGGYDPLQDWQREYYEGLKKCGKEVQLVEYPNAIHGFYIFPELPQLRYVIKEVRDFIQKQSDSAELLMAQFQK